MGTVKVAQTVQLTPEAFEPFGELIAPPAAAPDSETDALSYWHDLIQGRSGDELALGYFRLKQREAVVEEMESHPEAAEVFIPLKGSGVMLFAPSKDDGTPGDDRAVAFEIDGATAFLIARGVWHAAAFPDNDSLDFLLALPAHAMEPRYCRFAQVGPIVIARPQPQAADTGASTADTPLPHPAATAGLIYAKA